MLRAAIVILALLSAPLLQARQAPTGAAAPVPQNPQDTRPARDPKKPKETGTARIRGRVIGGENGAPLRRASVRVNGEGMEGGRSASTDENGRYEIKDLPASRVQVTASKGGYAMVNYGQRRPMQPGRMLDLVDGQTLELDFNLPRGGVISGRLTDDLGEPAIGMRVSAGRWLYFNGKRQLVPVGASGTDDLGRFRIFGLPAGDYYVMTMAGAPNGPSMQSADDTAFATTYFPGTASTTDAQRLRVVAGGDNSTANFSLVPSRTAKITGVVVDSGGRPVASGWMMMVQTSGAGMFSMSPGGEIHTDGTFTIAGVAPGEYALTVQTGSDSSPDERESAYVPLSVSGADMSDVTIALSKGSRVTGQIAFETEPPSDKRLSAFTMWVHSPDPNLLMMGGNITPRDDATFETRIQMSPAVVSPGRMPDGWSLKSVLQSGVDVTDTGLQFKVGEDVDNVQIVLTSRTTVVSGQVADSKGLPSKDYTVVVFPDDSARWVPMSRYIRTERPDQQGRFRVKGLPPGHYLAVAVDSVENGQESDPEFLEQLRSSSTPFDLNDNEQKSLALKMSQQ